jgi:protein phosphatase
MSEPEALATEDSTQDPPATMKIAIPEFALVLLVGPSGCGKSTFARKHFKATEVLSSDFFRGLVCDDEASQAASKDAFEVLHLLAAKRLAALKLTVIDATNVLAEARQPLLQLARKYHCPAVALVFDLPEEVCNLGNRQRIGRTVGPEVVHLHQEQLRQALSALKREAFQKVHVLTSRKEMDAAVIEREPLSCNLKNANGPFDIIGDIHGCFDELVHLLGRLGYQVTEQPAAQEYTVHAPEGRRVIFVGDLVDRGPRIPAVLRLVMGMVQAGIAYCVLGNHDNKLERKLKGNAVKITHGLAESLDQLKTEPPEFRERVGLFLRSLVSHYVLDGGKLVVAHAGLKEELQGRISRRVEAFARYGETSGESDEFGLPVRLNWAAEYRGQARVVYGHTPVREPEWLNRTLNIDTGCVFGGKLTALRYPELELVSVPALKAYCQPARPLLPRNEGTGEETSDLMS